mmetsp:Transcript_58546/g.189662  ORF Transcript_58546/g.189662 Transcript_58546/m.189662 type:complete len:99 (-) Transcript_58546:467-763(-)
MADAPSYAGDLDDIPAEAFSIGTRRQRLWLPLAAQQLPVMWPPLQLPNENDDPTASGQEVRIPSELYISLVEAGTKARSRGQHQKVFSQGGPKRIVKP